MSEQDKATKAKEITNRSLRAAAFWQEMFRRCADKLPGPDARGYDSARAFADAAVVDADERGCFRAETGKVGQ